MTATVSIIIPYFNDKKVIWRSLKHLYLQSYPLDLIEIIIVDDHSDVPVANFIEKNSPVKTRVFRHKLNKGSAASRNTGIKNAENELLIFIDSDVLTDENFVMSHAVQYELNQKVLRFGTIKWHPDVRTNNFTKYGRWFEYDNVLDKPNLDFNDFNGANFSVSRKELKDSGVLFDDKFKQYGMEDIEFGYLLKQKGFKFEFCHDALVWHYRQATLADQVARAKKSAYSIAKFITKHHDENILKKLRFLTYGVFNQFRTVLAEASVLSGNFLTLLDYKTTPSLIEQEIIAMSGIFLIEYAPWKELYNKRVGLSSHTDNYEPELVNSAVDFAFRINLVYHIYNLDTSVNDLYARFIFPLNSSALKLSLCYETGRYLFFKNEFDQADWILRKALEIENVDIQQLYLIHYLLASISKRIGQIDSARKYFQFVTDKAVNRIHASQYASAFYHLGDISLNEYGNRIEAKEYFQKALDAYPLHQAAGEALSRCSVNAKETS